MGSKGRLDGLSLGPESFLLWRLGGGGGARKIIKATGTACREAVFRDKYRQEFIPVRDV